MAFCEKQHQLVYDGTTCLDNRFIFNYLPDAPNKCVAVYLLGLALADSNGADNSCEAMAKKLDLSEDEVIAAFLYWEELGLVHITFSEPKQIVYLDVRESNIALKKVNAAKYKKFVREMEHIINGRTINTGEFDEYINFLEKTTFEPEALLAVAKYCVELKGNDISRQYILTVARNQMVRGATTLALVAENLTRQQKYDDDLRILFKALDLSRNIDYNDRVLYEKWTKEFGFAPEVIVAVAKTCKGKGVGRLDNLLSEYYKKRAFSLVEIQNYQQEKEHLYNLAISINRAIGVYYENLGVVVDEYVVGWVHRGYDDETLLAIAQYCFRSGIRTLKGLASVMDNMYKNGITTIAALDVYFADLAHKDSLIKQVLEAAGLERNVTNNDRMLFRTWTEKWNMPLELILFAAEKSAGTTQAIAYLNKLLSIYKQKGISTVEQAQAESASTATAAGNAKRAIVGKDTQRATYTDEQLNALFTALDETED